MLYELKKIRVGCLDDFGLIYVAAFRLWISVSLSLSLSLALRCCGIPRVELRCNVVSASLH